MDVTAPIIREQMRRVFIHYSDAKGDVSHRIIQPLFVRGDVDPDDTDPQFTVSKVDARCETARAKRTFLISRIEHVADFETGEIMTTGDWVKSLSVDTSDLRRSIHLHRQMRDAEPDGGIAEMNAQWTAQQEAQTRQISLWRAIGFAVLVGIIVWALMVGFGAAGAAP